MIAIAVDDERLPRLALEEAIEEAAPDCEVHGFVSAGEALDFARERQVDMAFLDIEMTDMDGLACAKALKDICGRTNIIFVTGHTRYAMEAHALHVSGYLQKPVTAGDIRDEIDNLRTPIRESGWEKGVRILCFGSFRIYVDGKLLLITRAKPKELLAYLVHKRGAAITSAEIAAVLWEDQEYTSAVQAYTRKVISQLIQILKEAGIGDIIQKGWNRIAVNTEKISCDYYDFLAGDGKALNAYTGEYMSEYSWAEFTVGYLDEEKHKHKI